MKNNAAISTNRRSAQHDDDLRVGSMDFQHLPAVLTSREAANVLRVGVREVRTLIDSGQLAGTRLGPRKVIRVSRAALLQLIRVQSAG